MAATKFQGNEVNTVGALPEVGTSAPDFLLTKGDLSDVSIKDFAGRKLVLNIFPSVDTGVCAASVRRFNQEAAELENTEVLCISRDLPFAQGRFCGAEGIENVTMLSELRNCDFGRDYGLRLADGALAGLFARAVLVIDGSGQVAYCQLVSEITEEPDYEAALAAVKGL